MARKLTFLEFVDKAISIHGDRYNYPPQEYINNTTKMQIDCKIHGVFYQSAQHHWRGIGCPVCANEKMKSTKSCSFDEIVDRANAMHNGKYAYHQESYSKIANKMKITCPIHGDFLQIAHAHISGQSCKQCTLDNRSLSFDEFIIKATALHKGKYKYPDQTYSNTRHKIKILCPEHGIFEQTVNSHLSGHGCKECGLSLTLSAKTPSFDEVVRLFNQVHNNKYTYPQQDYVNNKTKIRITCPVHGDFFQIANSHLGGKGCLSCVNGNNSECERNLSSCFSDATKINNHKIPLNDITSEVRKPSGNNSRSIELDIFFPDKNVAVEFHGLYWHSEARVGKTYHLDKMFVCKEKGIDLIQIFEDEWENKPEIVQSIINTRLGIYENRYMARKTDRVEVDSKTACAFYEANHIQGKVGAKNHYGLVLDGELVAMASFGIRSSIFKNNHEIELIRFCTKLNTQVIGGLSKLMKPFTGIKVKTYCDLRLFNGNGYKSVGFKVIGESKPGYYYVKSNTRYSRFQFQKHKLANMLDVFDSSLSESENMKNNGYSRIYDCGNLVMEIN